MGFFLFIFSCISKPFFLAEKNHVYNPTAWACEQPGSARVLEERTWAWAGRGGQVKQKAIIFFPSKADMEGCVEADGPNKSDTPRPGCREEESKTHRDVRLDSPLGV